jgi:hypothetical protein
MRIAKCVKDLHITVLGNQGSVSIGLGWTGDLDQVIGQTDRGPLTVADALGAHLTPDNFVTEGPRQAAATTKSTAAAPPAPKE